MTDVTKTDWEVRHHERHRHNCFRVRFTAFVYSDSPEAAVAGVWAELFRPSNQDHFSVYQPRTAQHSTHRASVLLPEFRRDRPISDLYIVTWDTHAFAGHPEGALAAVLAAYFKATDRTKQYGLSKPEAAQARDRLQ
tara:strand:- start:314 stop:724 length:411 start_codon:yes stop_codon:yes gene_type:complete